MTPLVVKNAGPTRRCIVTMAHHDTADMIRFVVGEEGRVYPDVRARLPGKGLWLCAQRHVLQKAIKRKAFARAARREVNVPHDLLDMVESQLATQIVHMISLSRKANRATSGYHKVREWLHGEKAFLLIRASDTTSRQSGSLHPLPDGHHITILRAEEIAHAFNADTNVVFCGIQKFPLALRIVRESRRLAGIRLASAYGTPKTASGEHTNTTALGE